MSQYSFQVEGREIVFGWDNPLGTFFVQVWEDSDDDDPVMWMGTNPGEVASVEALAELVRPYGEIPAGVLEQLRSDFENSEPLTEWQKTMRATLTKP